MLAIVAAFGFDERTVASWLTRAGQHCRKIHESLVEQGQIAIQHCQADELWVRLEVSRLDGAGNALPTLAGQLCRHPAGFEPHHAAGGTGTCRYPASGDAGLCRWVVQLRDGVSARVSPSDPDGSGDVRAWSERRA